MGFKQEGKSLDLWGSKSSGVGVGRNGEGLRRWGWRFWAGFFLIVLVGLFYQRWGLMQHTHFLFFFLFVFLTSLRLLQICWLQNFSAFSLVVLRKPILFVAVRPHLFLLVDVSEDVLKLLENDAGDDDHLLCIDEFSHWGYLRTHEARSKHYAEVVLAHLWVLSEGQDSVLQEVEEKEDSHPVDLRKLFDVLADYVNEVWTSFFLHEQLKHRIRNDWGFEEGNEPFDGIYIWFDVYLRWREGYRLMQ